MTTRLKPMGFQQITGLSTVKALTIPTGAVMAVVRAETQAVRWRDDGTAPTASIGMEILVGQELHYDADMTTIQFIEETASATLSVSYYA